MKIRISDIPHTGLKVNDTLPLEALNARMAQGRLGDIVFTEAPKVDLTISHIENGAETKGTVSTKYRRQCARCLEDLDRSLTIEANFTLHQKPAADEIEKNEVEFFADDVGITYFEGENIDLEDLIQEALILPLTLYWAPECDAKGNCSVCGINRSKFESRDEPTGTNLGNLMKKAGLN